MARRPSVVMVSPYPPDADGIGVHAAHLVAALAPKAEVSVLARARRDGRGDDGGAGGTTVARVLTASPACTPRALAALEAAGAEVVHLQYNLPALGLAWLWAGLATTLLRRRRGNRVVVTLHEVRRDLDLLGPPGALLLGAIARWADVVVVYTAEAKALLVERCGAREEKVAVLPHGAPEAFPPSSHEVAPPAPGPVLSFGYLHPDKGIEVLLDAVAALRRRDPALVESHGVVVAGAVRPRRGVFRWFEARDRAYARALRKKARRLGLGGVVRFAGHVPDEDVAGLLASAAVAVLPYRNASQSGVCNLLLASRTPVVASALPGLAETLGDAAAYAPVGDAIGLAAALEQVLGDPARRAAMATAMAAAHDQVRFASVADRLLALYGRASSPASPSGGPGAVPVPA